ncbi:hypothetical protein ACI6PS_03625 [Flavobacterium sp. PLA-1-15]|uniref:hypothetical protein n=1 Tax=Flavobacterium sp. PLA-1-15 TaxID=3380533 RepID=UPI003B809AA8
MKEIIDTKLTVVFTAVFLSFQTLTINETLQTLSLFCLLGYNAHRWIKFHQETRSKKTKIKK